MYFHHPSYFGVGSGWPGGTGSLVHGVYSHTRPLYRVFYRNGGDVVLNGHEHYYQRTVPINPLGKADPAHGFTEFIVGTGGDTLQPMPPVSKLPKEIAAASNSAFGILAMTLEPHGYKYRFVPVQGAPAAGCTRSVAATRSSRTARDRARRLGHGHVPRRSVGLGHEQGDRVAGVHRGARRRVL